MEMMCLRCGKYCFLMFLAGILMTNDDECARRIMNVESFRVRVHIYIYITNINMLLKLCLISYFFRFFSPKETCFDG